MKKIISLFLLATLAVGCLSKSDDGKNTPKDIYFRTNEGKECVVSGKFYVGEKIKNASISMTILNGYGREIIVSAEEQGGICIEPTRILLKEGGYMNEVTVPITGTITLETPGLVELTMNIEFGEGKSLKRIVPINVYVRPAFDFEMDGEWIKMTSSGYNDIYGCSILGAAPYDSNKSPLVFSLPYSGGSGRSIKLDSYDAEILDGEGDGITLELSENILAEDSGVIKMIVSGTLKKHATIIFKNFSFTVGDNIVLNESTNAKFPEQKIRLFDVMHTHVISYDEVSGESITQTLGYDEHTVSVEGADGVTRNRTWLDPMLGVIDPSDSKRAPFLFQWGRKDDGHQVCYSNADIDKSPSTTKASLGGDDSQDRINGIFVTVAKNPDSWQTNPSINDNLWDASAGGGVNNPCPQGYRLPTKQEVAPAEFNLAKDYTAIKWGNRNGVNGKFQAAKTMFLTCTPSEDDRFKAYTYDVDAHSVNVSPRSTGYTIRCIKAE